MAGGRKTTSGEENGYCSGKENCLISLKPEDGEADVSVTVDVRVDGDAVAGKDDLGGVEGVLRTELEL